MELGIEAGADDVRFEGGSCVLEGDTKAFAQVLDALEQAGIETERAELTMVADNTVAVSDEDADKVLRLIDKLEDLDDVQRVFANCAIDDDTLARLGTD